jgi:hypothetical protein
MENSQTHARPRRLNKPARERMVDRIREILMHFGGEAHRRDVIVHLAKESGVDTRNIPEDLEAAVILSFEEAWKDEARRAAYGLILRFGEGSHRWGVRMPELAH